MSSTRTKPFCDLTSPDQLTNNELNNFGLIIEYNPGLFSTKNRELVGELLNYKLDTIPEEKWRFLVSIYERIPGRDFEKGEMGKAIIAAFKSAFPNQLISPILASTPDIASQCTTILDKYYLAKYRDEYKEFLSFKIRLSITILRF